MKFNNATAATQRRKKAERDGTGGRKMTKPLEREVSVTQSLSKGDHCEEPLDPNSSGGWELQRHVVKL